MSQEAQKRKKIFKPAHELPGKFWLDYILLPYGAFYRKTAELLEARAGDTLRFFNGPDREIASVRVIPCDAVCNFLCRMRYGIDWDKALVKWQRYAQMEGHAKDVLSTKECLLVIFNVEDSE